MAQITLVEAINLALKREMERDAAVVVLGEDVGVDGGVFRATLGLIERFGPERVIDTPLAEAGILGTAVGLCMAGWRPVCEMQYDAFSYPALDRARSGGGPTLIEALTYRLSDHTTADDATRYRSPDEVAEAWKLDPIVRLRTHLMAGGAWNKAKEDALLKECNEQVQAAAQAYLDTPPPTAEQMFDHLYATLPAALQKQRAAALGE